MSEMHNKTHVHEVQIYYEDTDHSGAVYHANYLRYFERAREHILGVQKLVDLQKNHGIGFVVYKAALTYKAAAHFGDSLHVETRVTRESDYRLCFEQNVVRPRDNSFLVEGVVQLACVGPAGSLVRLPI